MPTARERAGGVSDESEQASGGLDFGITAWHMRLLCEPANAFGGGGAGMTIEQVAMLTPDQAYFRLFSLNTLKVSAGGKRIKKVSADGLPVLANKDGMVAGITRDGKRVYKTIGSGKSRARKLMEEARQKRLQERGRKRGT